MKIRDETLHKLRHHRNAGPHTGKRRPQIGPTLVPLWCPRCQEVTIDTGETTVCPYCEDDTLSSLDEED